MNKQVGDQKPSSVDIIDVTSPELQKIYEEIIATEMTKVGRDRQEALSESIGSHHKFLLKIEGNYIGAGRVTKIEDTYYLQRGCLKDEFRSQGYFNLFVRHGVELIHSIRQPHEKVAAYVNVFSRKATELCGFVVDLEHPVRIDASPLIYDKSEYKGS